MSSPSTKGENYPLMVSSYPVQSSSPPMAASCITNHLNESCPVSIPPSLVNGSTTNPAVSSDPLWQQAENTFPSSVGLTTSPTCVDRNYSKSSSLDHSFPLLTAPNHAVNNSSKPPNSAANSLQVALDFQSSSFAISPSQSDLASSSSASEKLNAPYLCPPIAVQLLPTDQYSSFPGHHNGYVNPAQPAFHGTVALPVPPPPGRGSVESCPPHVILAPYPFLPPPTSLMAHPQLQKEVTMDSSPAPCSSMGVEAASAYKAFVSPQVGSAFPNSIPLSASGHPANLDPSALPDTKGTLCPPPMPVFQHSTPFPIVSPFYFPPGTMPMEGAQPHFVLMNPTYPYPGDLPLSVPNSLLASTIPAPMGVSTFCPLPPSKKISSKGTGSDTDKSKTRRTIPQSRQEPRHPMHPMGYSLRMDQPTELNSKMQTLSAAGTFPPKKECSSDTLVNSSFNGSSTSLRKENSVAKSLEDSLLELDYLESKIDLSCTSCKGKQFDLEKQEGFIRTLNSVYTIVKDKLYRARHCTMEQYFSQYHKISRAQVYRLLDCHTILEELYAFPEKPLKQRICRTLKKVTPNPAHRRKLWQAVLNKHGHNAVANLTSGDITSTWRELILADPSLQVVEQTEEGHPPSFLPPTIEMSNTMQDAFMNSAPFEHPCVNLYREHDPSTQHAFAAADFPEKRGVRSRKRRQAGSADTEPFAKRRCVPPVKGAFSQSSSTLLHMLTESASETTLTATSPSSEELSASGFHSLSSPKTVSASSMPLTTPQAKSLPGESDLSYYSKAQLDLAGSGFKFSEFEEWDFEAKCMAKLNFSPQLRRDLIPFSIQNENGQWPTSMSTGLNGAKSLETSTSYFYSTLSPTSTPACDVKKAQHPEPAIEELFPSPKLGAASMGVFSNGSPRSTSYVPNHPHHLHVGPAPSSASYFPTSEGVSNEFFTLPPYLLHAPTQQAYLHFMQQYANAPPATCSSLACVYPSSLAMDSLPVSTLSSTNPFPKSLDYLATALGFPTEADVNIDYSSSVS